MRIHLPSPTHDADSKTELHKFLGKVFAEPGEDLRPFLPNYWRYYREGTDSRALLSAWQADLDKSKAPPVRASDSRTGADTPPRIVRDPEPEYSNEGRSHCVEGTSVLGTVVDALGTPTEIAILQPLGMGLDEQAATALSQWKFEPAVKNGQPVRARIVIQMNFRGGCISSPGH